ncbi:MAG: helix-turn-helix domain-containing protein [Clostridia bacterium]|nr:helix-turn-helix domain-containing protein [Clostridia bacterium]
MTRVFFRSYGELPLFLCADHVAKLLGISISGAYELMQEASFPVLKDGDRKAVPKEKLLAWVEKKSGGSGA